MLKTMELPAGLKQKLLDREQKGTFRQLKIDAGAIDFCSNDYLGLARSAAFRQAVEKVLPLYQDLPVGATGSRLLSGNYQLTEEIEAKLATFHGTEAALLFNSGYAANTGFFSAVPQRGDTIFYDEASHASIKDGIRLSFANAYPFRHNSPEDLLSKFKHAVGQVYVAVESLYSMDGDFAPLIELVNICEARGANLVVDEAHSNGLFNYNGAGLVQELGLQDKIFARIMTFGKALGCHGAAVVGASDLKDFLINFSRPFIYTTALPLHTLVSIKCAYQLLPGLTNERVKIKSLAEYLYKKLISLKQLQLNPEPSPIKAVRGLTIPELKNTSKNLQQSGFDVRPIFSPTVPVGKEQLRIIVHAFNTETEIDQMAVLIAQNI